MRNHRKFGFCYFSYTLKGFLIRFSLKLHFFTHSLSIPCTHPPAAADLQAQNLAHLAGRLLPFHLGWELSAGRRMAGGEISQRKPFKAPEILWPWGFQNNWPCLGAPGRAPLPRFLHHQKSTETAGSGPISFGKHRLIHAPLSFQGFCLFLPKTDGNKCGESEVRAALLKKKKKKLLLLLWG